jgi:gamma-carbonic anhydrase
MSFAVRLLNRRLVHLSVPVRLISQKDVSGAADAAAEAAVRRDFERHGLKYAVPASVKYSDDRKHTQNTQRKKEKRKKEEKFIFFSLFCLVGLKLVRSIDSWCRCVTNICPRYHTWQTTHLSHHAPHWYPPPLHLPPSLSLNILLSSCQIGNVEVWDHASVWYGCVLKGDVRLVRIGAYTNVQDKSVITESTGELDADHDGSTVIGHYVTIGHKCTLRACTIESEVIVGMGSVVEDGAYIEKHAIIGAGSLVAAGTRVPSGELWLGRPAKFVRKLTNEEIDSIYTSAINYREVAKQHDAAVRGSGSAGTAHWILEQQGHADRIGAREWPAVEPEFGLKKPDM